MKFIEFLEKVPEETLIYLSDTASAGGWGAIGSSEYLKSKFPYLKNEEIKEMGKLYVKNDVFVRLKGEFFPRKRFWDLQEYRKEKFEPVRIKSNKGAEALSIALYKGAYVDYCNKLLTGGNSTGVKMFLERCEYMIGDCGEYLLKKAKEDTNRIKEFVKDFIAGEETEKKVPESMNVKMVRAYCRKKGVKMQSKYWVKTGTKEKMTNYYLIKGDEENADKKNNTMFGTFES